jgi:Na+-transporting methylmalonyl-CoA/oxaloacetate decarboxylase gamma subunit
MSDVSAASGSGPAPTLFDLHKEHTELLRAVRQERVKEVAGDVHRFVLRAKDAGTYLFENDQRIAAQGFIDFWTTTLYRAAVPINEVELAQYDSRGAAALECPYAGLKAFSDAQSRFFFGRDQVLNDALDKLRAGRRLIAILGPSGSGKSSLLLAGLIPRLKLGHDLPGSGTWRYLPTIVPGSDPLKALAGALAQDDVPRKLRKRRDALLKLAEGETPMVVTVDQFEELFTLCEDAEVQAAFAENLVSLATGGGAHLVIVTMRSDHERYLANYPGLRDLFTSGGVRVTAMTLAELRDAIERPAREVHLPIEQGLAEAIAKDLVTEGAALPLLQFTLRKLFDSRDGQPLRLSMYDELGGARNALGNAAHQLYASIPPEKRDLVRRVMLRMVRPGSQDETTSNRVRVTTLMEMPGTERADVRYVIDELLRARLIRRTGETADDEQVEVAHEALIRKWPELDAWLERAREDLRELRRYEAWADQWERGGRIGGRLDEKQIEDVTKWLKENDVSDLGVNPALPELIEASRKEVQRRKSDRRFVIIFLCILSALVIVVGVLLGLSWYRNIGAERAKLAAEAAKAVAERDKDRSDTALKIATEKAARQRETDLRHQLESLLRTSTDEQIALINRRYVEPLKKENAALKRQLAMPAPVQLSDSTELVQTRTALAAAQSKATAIETLYDARQTLIQEKSRETDELRHQLAAATRQPVYDLFTDRLHVNYTVRTTNSGEAAGICCFLKNGGQHFLVSTGEALAGEPGDLVVYRGGSGKEYRVANVWAKVGDGPHAATVARLLSRVRVDEKLPQFATTGRKEQGFRGTGRPSIGAAIKVIGRVSQSEGSIVAINDTTITIKVLLAPDFKGAPVVIGDRHLIGFVSAIEAEKAIVTRIDPIFSVEHEGWELDE